MKTGLLQCKDAILNTVGPGAKPLDIDLVEKTIREDERKKIKTDVKSKARNRKKKVLNEKMQDSILLGKMGKDVTFLKDLLANDTEIIPASYSAEQVRAGKFEIIIKC